LEKGFILERVLLSYRLLNALNAIAIVILSLVIIYLVNRQIRIQQAVSWWQEQGLEERYAESEGLRNQTLQSLFGIRRQMEQLQDGDSIEVILEEVHQCQQDLTQLSDRLFSAYGVESLPLALKDLWQEIAKPSSRVRFEVHGTLESMGGVDLLTSEPMMKGQLLLVWLRKILKVGVAEAGLERIDIKLARSPVRSQLSSQLSSQGFDSPPAAIEIRIRFHCQDTMVAQRFMKDSELRVLAKMLTRLTIGRCTLSRQGSQVWCQIRWAIGSDLGMIKF
jgi:hypothetical protein